MRRNIQLAYLLLIAVVCGSLQFAAAQSAPAWGTIHSPTGSPASTNLNPAITSPINPSLQFGGLTGFNTNVHAVSAGVALRNRGEGVIHLSGLDPNAPGSAIGAFFWWAVITAGPPSPLNHQLTIQRISPSPSAPITILGQIVGAGPQPCWAGDTITVFRGPLPSEEQQFIGALLAPGTTDNGNGLYLVSLPPGASGDTSGADPWAVSPTLPLIEGASMTIIRTVPESGHSVVLLYDAAASGGSALAGNEFNGTLSYTLNLPPSAVPSSSGGTIDSIFSEIGADGQHGSSLVANPGGGNETTVVNGIVVAGPGSPYNDSDWNGSAGLPLPQLWDDAAHDVGDSIGLSSGTNSLAVQINATGDCLATVANILEVHQQ
jgi:hypothetical protein